MSDIIHLLPDSVANQIAAGEVIQRPASIIKELVENSLDAGATHIQVVVEDAGKSLVQVIDNGKGMSSTDARLSFERHATSKIRQATDLFSLCTMGFRGEALASIAAVAQVELRTRQEGTDLGTVINIEGSRVVRQEPGACPVGANFCVRNLFFNIPARRKFLKSNQTELSNILAEFERIALAHPETAFTLRSDGNVVLELPKGNFRQRIVGIFGRRIDSQLVPIEVSTTLVRIKGFVGMPSAAKKKNAHQYLFVNGRFMRHPYFTKAILMAYERLIADGLQIPYFVTFEVEPSRIDVNIHPTKTEIKFEDDQAIFQILMATVREALGKFGAVPALDFDTEARPDIPTFNPDSSAPSYIAPPKVHINTSFNPFEQGHSSTARPVASHAPASAPIDWQSVYDNALKNDASPVPAGNDTADASGEFEIASSYNGETAPGSVENTAETGLFGAETPADVEDFLSKKDFMQVRGRYIVTPLPSGLALIDQHRAHVRILYERYMRQLSEKKAPTQRLLFPETFAVSPAEDVAAQRLLPQLAEVGFEIESQGNGEYSVTGVPLDTEGIAPQSLLESILSDAVTGQADVQQSVGHVIALALARRVALPVGQCLGTDEMRALVQQLFATASPNYTPNGQSVLTIINPETLL